MSGRADSAEIEAVYARLLDAWNGRNAAAFAALFASDGNAVGFDGSQMDGSQAIESALSAIFDDHEPAAYLGVIREVRFLSPDVAVLRAVAGMVPPGETDLGHLTIQSMVAVRPTGRWLIALWHNTPAAFDGRPDAREALRNELRASARRTGDGLGTSSGTLR